MKNSRFDLNQKFLQRNLFTINRSLALILDMWNHTYKDLLFVDVKVLAEKSEAYDMTEFTVRNQMQ